MHCPGRACDRRSGPRRRWLCSAVSCWLVVALGQAATAAAFEVRPRFGRLTVKEGLASNWVLALARDRRGFLWAGTQDGLYRFDGGKFVAYRHSPSDSHSIPSPVAGVLFEDSRGRLWVGSRWANQGMALYDRKLDRFERLPLAGRPDAGQTSPDQASGLSDSRVNAIADAPGGLLWVATAQGVDLVDHDRGVFKHHPLAPAADGKPPRLATALLPDRSGTLWVGTTDGLYRLDAPSRRCVPWNGFADGAGKALDGQRIEAMAEDESGHLWIGTLAAGLFEIDLGQSSVRQYLPRAGDDASLSHAHVRALALDGAGTLWVGTENGGLDALDRSRRRFRRFLPDPFASGSIGSASVYALLADRQGILWVGTYDNGLNYYSPLEQRFGLVTASRWGLRDPRVTAFLEDHAGGLWIGTDGGGLCRASASMDAIICPYGPGRVSATVGPSSVLTLLQTKDGTIWTGGWGEGLTRLDPHRGVWTRFRHRSGDPTSLVSNDVWAIRELRSGEIAVATHQGTDLFDPRTGRATRLSSRYPGVFDAMTLAICETHNGDLWLGQNGRVQHVQAGTGQVTVYAQDRPGQLRLAGGQVFTIVEDSQANVWIGGEGGLAYLGVPHVPGGALVTKTGLPHQVVSNVVEDGSGNLWVTTHQGLSKLAGAIRKPASSASAHFDVHDGLQDNEFSRGAALRLRDGRLLLGGRRGLNAFFPDQVPVNAAPPPVVLTGMRVLGRPTGPGLPGSPLRQSITESASLSITQDLVAVTFEFAALNLVLPHKNRYVYMLEGLDTEWNDAGVHREATYTQLRHGDYVFRVRAANNDGVWNQSGLALQLRVEPRWHERTWVRVAMVVLGALLVLGGLGWRARRFRARERELTLRVDERTRDLRRLAAEIEDLNNQKLEALGILAGGIAHDFNNLLTGVFGYLELARAQASDPQKRADTLAKAISLMQKARGLTSQLLTFSKGGTPVLAPIRLSELLAKSAEFALGGSNVVCTMRLAQDLWLCQGDQRQIEQVFDNLLINARQAMSDGGEVSITAENVAIEMGSGVPVPKGRYLRVEVADRGPGIPREIQARIFEPFFTTKSTGTGLGLATAHSIVRKHHGHIEVSSEPGKGARFSIHLPAAETTAEVPLGRNAGRATRRARLLLLDDEPHVREVLEGMLRGLGHTVQAFGDGRAAVDAFAHARAAGHPFDLVLLDLTIPGGLGGREVLAELRALDPAVRAIAVSGYSADPAMTDPSEHNFVGKLGKPCAIEDLARLLGEALPIDGVASARRD